MAEGSDHTNSANQKPEHLEEKFQGLALAEEPQWAQNFGGMCMDSPLNLPDNCGAFAITPWSQHNVPLNRVPLWQPTPVSETQPPLKFIQMNGRKVYGPPADWIGPAPSAACELFIRRIPRVGVSEQAIVQPFLLFGAIYEVRIPIDYNQELRGYAYVKYTNEDDAARAMEVINHHYVAPQIKLEVLPSYEKSRLYIGNIPKELTDAEIEEQLRSVFPGMERVSTRDPREEQADKESDRGENICVPKRNRGYAFVHFSTHAQALEAKKATTPGMIRLWNRDVKVLWASDDRNSENGVNAHNCTLYVRNVDTLANNRDISSLVTRYVPRTSLRKITKVREAAFLEFVSRESAETCMHHMQGLSFVGRRLEVEWAKATEDQNTHNLLNTDFDAKLRLICMANKWHMPIVLFGNFYEDVNMQYGAVILRDAENTARGIFCIVNVEDQVDIHSRMCEAVCALIDTIGAFPDVNYTFYIEQNSGHMVGMATFLSNRVHFAASKDVPDHIYIDMAEMIDLGHAVNCLQAYSNQYLIECYHDSFRKNTTATFMRNMTSHGQRCFGTVMPEYRNKPSLKYDLNDIKMTLALCHMSSGTNLPTPERPYNPRAVNNFDSKIEGLPYTALKLLSLPSNNNQIRNDQFILRKLVFGGTEYYHPQQCVMAPPLWLQGFDYTTSIMSNPGNMSQLLGNQRFDYDVDSEQVLENHAWAVQQQYPQPFGLPMAPSFLPSMFFNMPTTLDMPLEPPFVMPELPLESPYAQVPFMNFYNETLNNPAQNEAADQESNSFLNI